MDLSSLDTVSASAEGASLELRNPVSDAVLRDEKSGEPVTITLVGTDSM